ncbi:hypothetical protein BFG57_13700 [Bacillus solimangrovi]|uniref:DUF4386 domain-containing protein n=2 Tax=Bacillus solimangrovi TaxID=1305675 RepID=A0A1E5LGC7_9BACI|nr:hypothetical protein BFG57_13700 [Bacillus solimangrovi]
MTISAAFSYGYVHSSLIISGDSLATFNKLQANISLFRAGIFGWLVIIITDILVSWAFYIYLKPIHQGYSLVAAWLRLMYTAILAIAVSSLLQAVEVVSYSTELFNQSSDTISSQVMISVLTFESVWTLGLILFGLHLLVVGIVVLKTKTVPKLISILLVIAGAGYMIIHLLYSFFPSLESMTSLLEMILSVPMIAGELGFGIWLLIKGGKTPSLK